MRIRLCSDEGIQSIKCPACKQLLANSAFDQAQHNAAVDAFLDGNKEIAQPSLKSLQLEPLTPAKRRKLSKKKKDQDEDGDGDEGEDGEDVEDHDAEIEKFMKSVAPTITLLPSGSFGKRAPYRCEICRNKSFPVGKIGECGKRKIYMVKHFIKSHLQSAAHLRALKMQEAPPLCPEEEKVVKVPCGGLCINDQQNARNLYNYRREFSAWASFSNFEEFGKHAYWHDASENSWWVRSEKCHKECDKRPGSEKQVCAACAALGSSHGVT